MLRVYGLTYDHTFNYGSSLQACALARTIENTIVGGERCSYQLIPVCEIALADMAEEGRERRANATPINRLKMEIFRLIYKSHKALFASFEKRHLRFVDMKSLEELPSLNERCDAFVCGSDVIWNSQFNFVTPYYYLDFAKKYKFSYAASFGRAEIDDEELETIREHILALNDVSCRERSGCAIVEERIGRPAELVVDPVLLMKRDEWDEIAEKRRGEGKYIFVYATHVIPAMEEFLADLKRKTGMKIVRAAFEVKHFVKWHILRMQKPDRWLRQLRDAEVVVTNSFHATAFAVLYHKKFFTFAKGEKNEGIYVRMNDFLREVGLENRLLNKAPEKPDLSEIDFSGADRAVEKMREDSMAFLRRNLEAAWRQKQRETAGETGAGNG